MQKKYDYLFFPFKNGIHQRKLKILCSIVPQSSTTMRNMLGWTAKLALARTAMVAKTVMLLMLNVKMFFSRSDEHHLPLALFIFVAKVSSRSTVQITFMSRWSSMRDNIVKWSRFYFWRFLCLERQIICFWYNTVRFIFLVTGTKHVWNKLYYVYKAKPKQWQNRS